MCTCDVRDGTETLLGTMEMGPVVPNFWERIDYGGARGTPSVTILLRGGWRGCVRSHMVRTHDEETILASGKNQDRRIKHALQRSTKKDKKPQM